MGFLDFLVKAGSYMVEQGEKQRDRVARDYSKKVSNYERKVDKYEKEHGSTAKTQKARQEIDRVKSNLNDYKSGSVRTTSSATEEKRKRRTDAEFDSSTADTDKKPRDFEYRKGESLKNACAIAASQPGVYILYLNGVVMKCGRVVYSQGIRWRFKQYYNLNYDKRAQRGDHWSVSEENRDKVTVAWQCCPESKSHELEYKLFRKYGKGPWASRAPANCNTDTWELLI